MSNKKGLSLNQAGDSRELAINLATAESQTEVINLLRDAGLWQNDRCWRVYGDRQNNFSTIDNQQASADQALVEKLMNSADAILLQRCLRAGIDPKSSDAPQTIKAALQNFLGYPHGRLAELPSIQRSDLATASIGLIATGQKGHKAKPNYTIFDSGIGQSPEQFPETFLSLNANNKSEIPFVQGKYNMGSTGVFGFLGEQGIQLILSRRDPSLPLEAGCSDEWGFTVVRREPPRGNMKYPIFTYLTDEDGEIFRVPASGLPILPDGKGNTYARIMEHGSFVKLFEYEIGAGLKTALTFDLYNRLSLLLPEMPVPVRLYEEREFKGHTMQATLAGLDTRIEDDRNDNLEPGFPASAVIDVAGSQVGVQILAFRKELDAQTGKKANRKDKYATKEGVVLSLNGQAHGFLNKTFFDRGAVGLGFIKDSLLVLADCSDLNREQQIKLFMPSRDRMRESDIKRELERSLEGLVKNHQGLKDLQARRRSEMIRRTVEDDRVMADTIQKLVSDSPALSALFLSGSRLADPVMPAAAQESGRFEGKFSPTFLRPEKTYSEDRRRECEQGRDHRFEFTTDADNDYFNRSTCLGQLTVRRSGEVVTIKSRTLWDGKLVVQIRAPQGMNIGEEFELCFELSDDSLVEPLTVEIPCVGAVRRIDTPSKPSPKPKERGNSSGDESRQKAGLALPQITPVSEEEWSDYDFDRESAIAVINSGGTWDFFYNKDNVHLKSEQKLMKQEEMPLAEKQYSTALVLMGLTLIQSLSDSANDAEGEERDIAGHVKDTTRALSPIILPIVRGLGRIDL